MARTWLSIRVDLVSGRGVDMWPRPGRVFAASRSHTFAQLGRAIDLAFARWDLAHLQMFTLADGTQITRPAHWDGEAPDGSVDDSLKLSRLAGGDQFAYVFDFGDDWAHLCTVGSERIDPLEMVGISPPVPTAYRGWGDLPDQYGRRYEADDGVREPPAPPTEPLADLPAILSWWGPQPD
jgi:hypothetical protein